MPARSQAQQEFFGAELARRRAGKKPRIKMSTEKVEEYASTSRKGLPKRARARTAKK